MGVRSGTAEAVPRKGVFAGRRDNGCARRAHSGRTPGPVGVRVLCGVGERVGLGDGLVRQGSLAG